MRNSRNVSKRFKRILPVPERDESGVNFARRMQGIEEEIVMLETIDRGISELERQVAALPMPDVAGLDNGQVQMLATRIMQLSGQLNQKAYRILFALDTLQKGTP